MAQLFVMVIGRTFIWCFLYIYCVRYNFCILYKNEITKNFLYILCFIFNQEQLLHSNNFINLKMIINLASYLSQLEKKIYL